MTTDFSSGPRALFKPHLFDGETLLWAERADQGAFDPRLLVVLMIGVALFAIIAAVARALMGQSGDETANTGAGVFTLVFLAFPSILIGASAWRLFQSYRPTYAVTSERILIQPNGWSAKPRALFLRSIEAVVRSGDRNDRLVFRLTPKALQRFQEHASIKISLGGNGRGSMTHANLLTFRILTPLDAIPDRFFKIRDAERVATLIEKARTEEEQTS